MGDERIAGPLRELRSKLNDEQLDALDELVEGLLAMDIEERRKICETLIQHIKDKIEDDKPVN